MPLTLRLRNADYSVAQNREQLVAYITSVLASFSLTSREQFKPYSPNNDGFFWVVDEGNNWRVIFTADKPDCFSIKFRYNCPTQDHESVLAAFLMMRMRAVPLTEDALAPEPVGFAVELRWTHTPPDQQISSLWIRPKAEDEEKK